MSTYHSPSHPFFSSHDHLSTITEWKLMWSWEMQVKKEHHALWIEILQAFLPGILSPVYICFSIYETGLRVESYGTGTQVR